MKPHDQPLENARLFMSNVGTFYPTPAPGPDRVKAQLLVKSYLKIIQSWYYSLI